MSNGLEYGSGSTGNGHDLPPDDAEIVAAMESQHAFPGYYPVVVIARRGEGFEERLRGAIEAQQGEAPWRLTERRSRQGNYVSYRVELHVDDARTALQRKAVLAELSGVLVLL